MAKRKATKEKVKKATRKKAISKKVTRKKTARRSATAAKPVDRRGLITHTELASADPAATQAWCETVLGWKFTSPMPTPSGPYRMWRFANNTGGGIRANNPPEVPGSIPYCEVADIRAAFSGALRAGAREMLAPQELPAGMGWIAIVAAPGGVAFGFWGPK